MQACRLSRSPRAGPPMRCPSESSAWARSRTTSDCCVGQGNLRCFLRQRMTEIPQRASLANQVAEVLRRDLRGGAWDEFLPGENDLCDRFQVSRVTMRAALDVLRREGLIEVSQGRRRRITSKARSTS